jgi:hypothetical protein
VRTRSTACVREFHSRSACETYTDLVHLPLVYQNPDLFHDLYVLKCVTTVVLTSGDRGVGGNFSLSLERGLQQAYAHMAGVPVTDPTQEETTVRVGTHDIHSWTLRGAPNIQIIYL